MRQFPNPDTIQLDEAIELLAHVGVTGLQLYADRDERRDIVTYILRGLVPQMRDAVYISNATAHGHWRRTLGMDTE